MEKTKKKTKKKLYHPIPYQKCPLCDGYGRNKVYNLLGSSTQSNITETCSVCKGAKIIPMFPMEINN